MGERAKRQTFQQKLPQKSYTALRGILLAIRHVHDGQRNANSSRLTSLPLRRIYEHYIVRQHDWFAQKLEQLSVELHLIALGKSQPF
jgi:hypothetical protein